MLVSRHNLHRSPLSVDLNQSAMMSRLGFLWMIHKHQTSWVQMQRFCLYCTVSKNILLDRVIGLMIFYDVWWCLMMFDDVWWCLMMFDDVWWCLMMFDDVWWCLMMFDDVWWCLILAKCECRIAAQAFATSFFQSSRPFARKLEMEIRTLVPQVLPYAAWLQTFG